MPVCNTGTFYVFLYPGPAGPVAGPAINVADSIPGEDGEQGTDIQRPTSIKID